MPTVVVIDGAVVMMFFADHPPPHVHVRTADGEAAIDIRTREIREGDVPARKLAAVLDYIAAHEAELLARWTELGGR